MSRMVLEIECYFQDVLKGPTALTPIDCDQQAMGLPPVYSRYSLVI
jgi:hypothetical protein